jgi:hypothetical protein
VALIALDYDGTYTVDPEMWDDFIVRAQRRGHTVKIVTMRFDTPNERIEPPCGIEVVYTSRKAKARAFKADIWVDDSPHWLVSDAL